MSLIKLKTNSKYKALRDLFIRQNGEWVEAKAGWIKQNGIWIQVFPTPRAVAVTNTLNTSPYKGYTETQVLTITNSGNVPLKILSYSMTLTANFSTSFDFSQLEGLELKPGEHKSIDVVFSGITVGTETGQISFNADIGELGEEAFIVNINANVLPTYAQVTLNKKRINITQTVGDPPGSTTLEIRNDGNGDLEIYRMEGDSGIQLNDVPLTIPPGRMSVVRINNGVYGVPGTEYASIILQSNSRGTPNINIPVVTTVRAAHGSFTTSTPGQYMWKIPFGVTDIRVKLLGAGGGGAGCSGNEEPNNITGGYGGGGNYIDTFLTVTPNEDIPYYIGWGGGGGQVGGNGGDGEASTFHGLTAAGGGGGYVGGQQGTSGTSLATFFNARSDAPVEYTDPNGNLYTLNPTAPIPAISSGYSTFLNTYGVVNSDPNAGTSGYTMYRISIPASGVYKVTVAGGGVWIPNVLEVRMIQNPAVDIVQNVYINAGTYIAYAQVGSAFAMAIEGSSSTSVFNGGAGGIYDEGAEAGYPGSQGGNGSITVSW